MKRILIITILLCSCIVAQTTEPAVPDTTSIIGKQMVELQTLYNNLVKDKAKIELRMKQVEFAYETLKRMKAEEEKEFIEDSK